MPALPENFSSASKPHTQNEMSGEMDCRHLKLPQVTPESLGKVITPYVQEISHNEWKSLDVTDPGSEVVVLLFNMCRTVIHEIGALVLKAVEPQVLASDHIHLSGDNVTVQGGCSYCRVTEEDIQACFGNSLCHYFGEAVDVAQESSYKLDQLVRLFSAEITKRVNSSLAHITDPLSSNICYSPRAECISQMICDIGNIFKNSLEGRKRMKDGSCDNLACPDCDREPCCCFDFQDAENVEKDSAEIVETSDCLSESSACMDHLNPEPAPQLSDCSESQNILNSQPMASSRPPSPDYQINQSFLTVLLGKLVDHIAVNTRTSILNVDFEQLVYGVRRRTEGMLKFAPPQSVDDLHVPIYENLCWKFESKYALQAVMESGNEAFEAAVSETLISQLNRRKATKKLNYFKVGNLSPIPELEEPEPEPEPEPDGEERSGKVFPAPEIEEPEPEPDSRQMTAECVSQMADNRGNIFKNSLEGHKRVKDESCDNLACPDCDREPCCCFDFQDAENVEQDSAEIVEISDCLSESSACMDHLNPEPAPQLSDCSESQNILNSQRMASSRPPSPDYVIRLNFLIVLVGKLVDHIAAKTRTSILNVDFEQLVCGVRRRTEGLLNFAPLQSVDDLHVPIYKELCRKFTSKYVLQAVMDSGDEAFEFAVSESLISQLQKSQPSRKRWNYFKVGNLSPVPEIQTPEPHSGQRSGKVSPVPEIEEAEPHSGQRSGKVSPVCEIQTPEPHSGQRSQQTKPSPSKRSLGRTLKKKLSRWASNVVNFFK